MSDEQELADAHERLDRLEKAVTTLAAWLVGTGGLGIQDVRGIEAIIKEPTTVEDD